MQGFVVSERLPSQTNMTMIQVVKVATVVVGG